MTRSQKRRKINLEQKSKKKERKGSASQYRSQFEKRVAEQLEKAKIRFEYEGLKIPFVIPESTHKYVPDFILPNGIIIEAKGLWDSDSRKKMALIKEQHGEKYDIRLLFMRDQPIRKNSKTTYSDVCKKLGYKFAVKDIPDDWLH